MDQRAFRHDRDTRNTIATHLLRDVSLDGRSEAMSASPIVRGLLTGRFPAMREQARVVLGARSDIRALNHRVLGNGAVPLALLHGQV